MQSINERRIENERKYLENNKDRLPPEISYIMNNNRHYVMQIKGKKGTNLQDAYIICDIKLPDDFPTKPPEVNFRNDFQHINVYQGSYKICLYLINPSYWVSQTKLIEVFSAISEVMHNPTFHDPANAKLSDTEKRSKEEYNQFMLDQARRLSDPKYKLI